MYERENRFMSHHEMMKMQCAECGTSFKTHFATPSGIRYISTKNIETYTLSNADPEIMTVPYDIKTCHYFKLLYEVGLIQRKIT